MLFHIAALLILAAVAVPASATGAMTCNTPKEKWKTTEQLTAELTKQGWQVRKAKVDGGCYEVYGTTPEGDRVEAYFDPASFEKLLVSRRGEILYKKN
jgi:hypothetical protein